MRLWPLAILDQLPRQQLLGQHRECCALRGAGWGRKHTPVDYVFKHPYMWLWLYHLAVIEEMRRRGYYAAREWRECSYRGRSIGNDNTPFTYESIAAPFMVSSKIYPEHDETYIAECIENLKRKGVAIVHPKGKVA